MATGPRTRCLLTSRLPFEGASRSQCGHKLYASVTRSHGIGPMLPGNRRLGWKASHSLDHRKSFMVHVIGTLLSASCCENMWEILRRIPCFLAPLLLSPSPLPDSAPAQPKVFNSRPAFRCPWKELLRKCCWHPVPTPFLLLGFLDFDCRRHSELPSRHPRF